MFGLRATDEHMSPQKEQFTIGSDHLGKYLRFSGRSCKKWQGGLKHRRVDAKDLRIYAKPELGERCKAQVLLKTVLEPHTFYWSILPSPKQG